MPRDPLYLFKCRLTYVFTNVQPKISSPIIITKLSCYLAFMQLQCLENLHIFKVNLCTNKQGNRSVAPLVRCYVFLTFVVPSNCPVQTQSSGMQFGTKALFLKSKLQASGKLQQCFIYFCSQVTGARIIKYTKQTGFSGACVDLIQKARFKPITRKRNKEPQAASTTALVPPMMLTSLRRSCASTSTRVAECITRQATQTDLEAPGPAC